MITSNGVAYTTTRPTTINTVGSTTKWAGGATSSSTTAQQTGFLANKGAVAGTFTLLALALIFGGWLLYVFLARRKRRLARAERRAVHEAALEQRRIQREQEREQKGAGGGNAHGLGQPATPTASVFAMRERDASFGDRASTFLPDGENRAGRGAWAENPNAAAMVGGGGDAEKGEAGLGQQAYGQQAYVYDPSQQYQHHQAYAYDPNAYGQYGGYYQQQQGYDQHAYYDQQQQQQQHQYGAHAVGYPSQDAYGGVSTEHPQQPASQQQPYVYGSAAAMQQSGGYGHAQ